MASAPKPALEARESNDGHDGNEWMCEKGCGHSGTYSDVEAHETTCDGKPPVEPPVESLDRSSECRSVKAQVYHQVMKRIEPQVDALKAIIGRQGRELDRLRRRMAALERMHGTSFARLRRRMEASERMHGTSFARQPVDVRRRVRGGIKKGQTSKEKQRKLRRLYKMLDDGCCGRERYTQQPNPYVQAVDAYENLVPRARKVTTPTFE